MKLRLTLATALLLTAAACPSVSTSPPYDVVIPTDFVATVTNPFLPLTPGTIHTFQGETEDGHETNTVEVLSSTRTVMGISATTVHDRVYVEGQLVEETFDWYAQDGAGNVWYLGEDSRELENGKVVSTGGSWEAGVGGAKPGVVMWADPAAHLGTEYRQEYLKGEAEDWGKVVAVGQTVTVAYGTLTGCIKTEDWSSLEKGILENKYYCPQIGEVSSLTVKGEDERAELVSVTRG